MNLRYSGAVLIIFLAGCSASHPANPTSVLPGAPSLASRGVEPLKLNTKNVIYNYPTGGYTPYYVATGSDKNVWFTEGPWITKITTGGVSQEFTLPVGEYAQAGIAKGPDGNMWFTDGYAGNHSIGKIAPTGIVTEYTLPTSGAYPTDITAGPDGNLWFIEDGAHQIGKITTGGVITEYPGGSSSNAYSIVEGPDGNLYASTENGIEQITTAGVITSYSSTSHTWVDIVLGPDKQMWLTSGGDGFIEEFNPKTLTFSAAIKPDPASSQLWGLTVGRDGDVWIADSNSNSILVYEEKITTIGIRLNGELSFTDPNYGFELGYAVGTTTTQTQTISLGMGESVQFKNVDTEPHSAAFLGDATSNSAPWPGSFNGSTTQSPAGTAIGTTGWATGSLNPNKTSPVYETGLPGFYMIGCQYHYNTNEMRTVIVVH